MPETCAVAVEQANVDLIINAAAYTAVDAAEEEETTATLINGDTPAAIARAAAAKAIPMLHISTDYVFNGSGEAPWSVDDPVNPLGAYGRSKLKGEEGVRAVGGAHSILRTSWVFSAHGSNFVKTMLRLAETRDSVAVVSDQIGGPTAAIDIADALWTMAQAFHTGQGKSGTYHFSGGPDVSWADFAREIFAQTKKNIDVKDIPSSDYPTPAKRPANSRLDCSTLEVDYGIKRPDWRKSLADVLNEVS